MRPTDPDQLAITLRELAHNLDRCEPDDCAAVTADAAAQLAHLAKLCAAEADRPPMERVRDLVSEHVQHLPPARSVRAHG